MFYFHFFPQKFIEEKEFLAQLEASFQKCEEIHKNLGKAIQLLFDGMTIT